MNSSADEQLLARVRVGDAEALGEVFDSYGMPCLAIARAACVEQCTAEAAVLTAFLQLWRQPPNNADRLAAWLLIKTQYAAQTTAYKTSRGAENAASPEYLT